MRSGIEPGDSVLLLCPPLVADACVGCLDLLTRSDPSDENVLFVTLSRSPDALLADWRREADSSPGALAVVGTDVDVRSTAASNDADSTASAPAPSATNPTVHRVSSPGDLTEIGVRLASVLGDWDDPIDDRQVVACFDSVSTLLQHVPREQAFKFIHVVTERLAAADAVTHFHMDPLAHDVETIETFVPLFDAVFEYEGDAWTKRG